MLVAVAGYELRGLVAALARAVGLLSSGSATLLWSAALLGLVLGLILLQIAQGLSAVATVPRGVLWLLGAWCVVASALVVLVSTDGALSGHGAPVLALGRDGPWLDASVLLGLGALVRLSPGAVRWLARPRSSLDVSSLSAAARGPAQFRSSGPEFGLPSLPLRAGWSDRGPPRRLSPQAI
jgi:hypothetical protein